MTLSAGPRSEIRNDGSTTAQGELLATDGSVHHVGIPELHRQRRLVLSAVISLERGWRSHIDFHLRWEETRNLTTVQHIQSYRYSAHDNATTQRLSKMDIYLDAASLLPTAFAFNTYSTDGSQTVPVEVDFSNYQTVGGIQVPFRIQRYVAGSLGFDFSVTSVQFNSGLPDSLFAIQ